MFKRYKVIGAQVDAIQVELSYANLQEIRDFVGDALLPIQRQPNYTLYVKTQLGACSVHFGDYIIKGTTGHFFVRSAAVFQETYELVEK